MVVYTIATLAFFLMGVAVLHSEGLDPDGMRMVSTLARAYVPVFGEYAGWLFLIGALAVLYSTFLVATAGNARMWTDSFKLFGLLDRNNEKSHDRTVRRSRSACRSCVWRYSSAASTRCGRSCWQAPCNRCCCRCWAWGHCTSATAHRSAAASQHLWDVALVTSFVGLLVAGLWGAWPDFIAPVWRWTTAYFRFTS